jgi:UDP-glucose 4-epimerase
MGSKILVTGGSGFVGSCLVKQLSKDLSNEIVSIDNYYAGSVQNEIQAENVKYVYCNTATLHNTDSVMKFNPDIVYHLGEYSRITTSFNDIKTCHQFNIVGTFNILEYCRDKSAKLVYAGSSSKFGDDGNEHLSPYAWFKAKNAELINNYHDWFGLDYAIVYFYNVYGEGQICTGKMATVIGIFQEQYKAGIPLTVISPGTQTRDFTHIDDIVRGLILVGEKGSGDGYLIGTGRNHTLLEVAQAFNHPIEMIPEKRGERKTGLALPHKMFEEFGWTPQTEILDYIAQWTSGQSLL